MLLPHAGSLYALGIEDVLHGNEARVTFKLTDALRPERVQAAYERQVLSRPELRVRLVRSVAGTTAPTAGRPGVQANGQQNGLAPDPGDGPPQGDTNGAALAGGDYRWAAFTEDEMRVHLARELEALAGVATVEQLTDFAPTGEVLPFRLRVLDEHTLLVRANQAFTNTVGAMAWLEDWFGFYRAVDNRKNARAEVPELPPALQPQRWAPGRRPNWRHAATGQFWSLAWTAQQLSALGLGRRRSVNLARDPDGEPAGRGMRGYGHWRHVFDADRTQRLMHGQQGRGVSFTVQLLTAVARLLLDSEPLRDRVTLGLSIDLAPWMPDLCRAQPGNPTRCLEVPMRRGRDLITQARAGQRWLKRGVPYHLARLRESRWRDESKVVGRFAADGHRARTRRGSGAQFSACISSLGRRPELRRLELLGEWMSACTPSTTLMFTSTQVASTLAIELCYSKDLFVEAEVMALVERLPALLEAGPYANA